MRVALPLLLILACGPKSPESTTLAATAVSTSDIPTQTAEAAQLWEQRGDKAQLQASLTKYAGIALAEPTNRDAAYHLLRGWYFLGDGHETEKDAKLAAWATALQWGEKCLSLNAEYAALLAKGDEDPASAARAFTTEDVPCVYWYSSALGKWAKASGLTVTLKHLPTVKAFMTRVGELDATYYYSGPDRYWGAYYAAIPSFAGQDLAKSKTYFDKAIAANPTFLGTYVLLAENWAVKTQNRAEFEKTLNWVLAQSADSMPEVKPELEAEQRKARALLAQIDDFFAD